MRKSILNLLGGAFFGLLTLTFTACGNIDNPLEEIGNSNSKVAALAGALDEGAEVTFNFTMHGEAYIQYINELNEISTQYEISAQYDERETLLPYLETSSMSIQLVFKKKSGKYEFELAEAYINGAEIAPDNYDDYARIFVLEYVSKNNQLKVSLANAYSAEGNGVNTGTRTTEASSASMPLTTIIFDLSDDSYSQYVYPNMGYVVLESIEVNGENKTNLLKDKYPTKASFYYNVVVRNALGPIDYVVGTRGEQAEETPEQKEMFCVFYKDGETWADVNKRYKDEAGAALLKEPGDDGLASFDMHIDGTPGMPFYYYNEEFVSVESLTKVKYSEKVGSDGYLMVFNILVNNNQQ